ARIPSAARRRGSSCTSSWATSSDRTPRADEGGATDTGLSLGETAMRCVVTVWTWVGLVVAAPVALGAQAQGTLKIAFVHSQTILEQTPGYAAAESTLSKEGQSIRDSLQRMQQQWDSAMRAFDQQSLALSSAAKQAKQRDLQAMQQRLQQRQSEIGRAS